MFNTLCHAVDSFVGFGEECPKKSPAGAACRSGREAGSAFALWALRALIAATDPASQNQQAKNLQNGCCTNIYRDNDLPICPPATSYKPPISMFKKQILIASMAAASFVLDGCASAPQHQAMGDAAQHNEAPAPTDRIFKEMMAHPGGGEPLLIPVSGPLNGPVVSSNPNGAMSDVDLGLLAGGPIGLLAMAAGAAVAHHHANPADGAVRFSQPTLDFYRPLTEQEMAETSDQRQAILNQEDALITKALPAEDRQNVGYGMDATTLSVLPGALASKVYFTKASLESMTAKDPSVAGWYAVFNGAPGPDGKVLWTVMKGEQVVGTAYLVAKGKS
jgi:hypothetical protein